MNLEMVLFERILNLTEGSNSNENEIKFVGLSQSKKKENNLGLL